MLDLSTRRRCSLLLHVELSLTLVLATQVSQGGFATMDVATLSGSLQHVSSIGHTLSLEQRSVIEVALPMLRASLNLHALTFWGKIVGLSRSYFVAQGKDTGDVFGSKKTFLSSNCAQWALLPEADPVFTSAVKDAILDIRSPYTGVLSNAVSVTNPDFIEDDGTRDRTWWWWWQWW